mmetsp:Transcript_36387/g.56525  ORF Transcript_36387/g.56525 Transcript_36387/m.56525 type:complete len:443 (-) Transcript_36387:212-1540(-)
MISVRILFSISWLVVMAAADNGEKCRLCPNDEGVAKPTSIIPQLEIPGDPNPNCQDALDYAKTVDAEDETCSLLQAQAAFCGCPGVTPPTEPCSLCDDGNPPPQPDLKTGAGDTCGELAAYLPFISAEDCQSERGKALLRNAFGCGCAGATTDCAMCPDGTIQMNRPDNVVPFFSLVDGTGNPTCMDVAVAAASTALDEIDCDLIQKQAGFCGCANADPLNECTFCPSGETPAHLDLVVSTTDTCRELNDYTTYMDASTCESGRAANIKALGFVCGCPGVEAQCSLCPDGSDPPKPNKVPEDEGASCAALALDAAGLTEILCEDQRNTVLGIAAARCECEGAEYPSCSFQQNPNLCTEELLASIPDVDCECFAFCDFEFVQCHSYPGGLLLGEQCTGTPVAGCNRATAQKNKEKEVEGESNGIAVSWTLLGSAMPLLLAWSF